MQNMRKDGLVCIRRLNKKTISFFLPPPGSIETPQHLAKKSICSRFLYFHPSIPPCLSFVGIDLFPSVAVPFSCILAFLPVSFFALYSSTNFPCDDERERVKRKRQRWRCRSMSTPLKPQGGGGRTVGWWPFSRPKVVMEYDVALRKIASLLHRVSRGLLSLRIGLCLALLCVVFSFSV
jgi:hypothetical protein